MSLVVRRCTKCGAVETRNHWDSMKDAVQAGAPVAVWACAECGWPEPELLEIQSFDDVQGGHLVEAKSDDSTR